MLMFPPSIDDLVFISFVFEAHFLRVEVECGVGVVGHVETNFRADRRIDGCLYFFVEVEIGLFSGTFRKSRIVDFIGNETEGETHRTAGFQPDASRAEYLIKGLHVELHIEEIEFGPALGEILGVFCTVIFLHRFLERIIAVFVGREHKGGGDLHIADFGAYDVAVGFYVILDIGTDVFGSAGGRLCRSSKVSIEVIATGKRVGVRGIVSSGTAVRETFTV